MLNRYERLCSNEVKGSVKKPSQDVLILALVAALPLASESAAAQGLLGPLFGTEMKQDYETAPRSDADKAAKRSPKSQDSRQVKQKASPKAANAKPAPASTTPPSAAPDEQSTEATASIKLAPKVQARARFVIAAPLPPPRPWGNRDAPDEGSIVASQIETTPVMQAAREPAVQETRPERSASPAREAETAQTALVLIVRSDVLSAQDLKDRRIATGLSGESSERLQEMVERGSGLRVAAVDMSWGKGLESLARGEVDGVTVSLGPPLSPEETKGVALEKYQILEIPLDRGLPSADRR